MQSDQKQDMIARIWATIRKRDTLRQFMMTDRDEFQPGAQVLMNELARFCYLNRPTTKVSKITGRIDSHASAIAEGRREVVLRILELLRFTDEKALKLIEQLNEREG